MPVTEIINGVECVFPESREASFEKFGNLVKEELYRLAMSGQITMEELEEMTKE